MNEALVAKPVSVSRSELTVFMLPHHANPYGSIHGGVILMHMDSVAGMVAMRHCRANAVTVAMDYVHFLAPTHVGEVVCFKASLNHVSRTSMEIGVRVEAEDLLTGETRHTASAYLTFVAMNKSGRPAPVPPLILETDEDRRHFHEAEERRRTRLGCKA